MQTGMPLIHEPGGMGVASTGSMGRGTVVYTERHDTTLHTLKRTALPHLAHTCTQALQALPDIDTTVSASDAIAVEDVEGVRGKEPFWTSMHLTWFEDLERGG